MANERIILGQRIRKYRRSLLLTQEELAERARLDATYVSQLERGHKDPNFRTLRRLAAALNTTVGELVGPGDIKDDQVVREIARLIKKQSPARRRKLLALLRDIVAYGRR